MAKSMDPWVSSLIQAIAARRSGHLPERQVSALVSAIRDGLKVKAVKEIRALAECGLREALDLHKRHIGW